MVTSKQKTGTRKQWKQLQDIYIYIDRQIDRAIDRYSYRNRRNVQVLAPKVAIAMTMFWPWEEAEE